MTTSRLIWTSKYKFVVQTSLPTIHAFLAQQDPQSYKEAMSSESKHEWIQAMGKRWNLLSTRMCLSQFRYLKANEQSDVGGITKTQH